MVKIEIYMENIILRLRERFGQRLLYVGMQGSYLRGEATENSDIDVMVVLDELKISDLETYRQVKDAMDESEKACGFICGKGDLAHWNPLEICHLLHTTKDCFGNLAELVPEYTQNDVRNFVKMSINNLYHELCHRYIYGDRQKNIAYLPGTYKGVFFILQNLHYLESGAFISTKKELQLQLSGKNRRVLERAMALSGEGNYDFDESFELLFTWCQETLCAL